MQCARGQVERPTPRPSAYRSTSWQGRRRTASTSPGTGGLLADLQKRTEKIATQEVEIKQEANTLHLNTLTRGLAVEEGGYHWSGELRLWDNEILMGWYASNDGSIRSKGTMYFVLHPHGLNMPGRWVGLGYDDQIMTGFASMAHSREESEEAMTRLVHSGGEVTRADE